MFIPRRMTKFGGTLYTYNSYMCSLSTWKDSDDAVVDYSYFPSCIICEEKFNGFYTQRLSSRTVNGMNWYPAMHPIDAVGVRTFLFQKDY